MTKLLIWFPLCIAFIFVILQLRRSLPSQARTADDKEVTREALKGLAYIAAGVLLVGALVDMWTNGFWSSSFGVLISAILSLLIILTVVELPSKKFFTRTHNFIWKDGPQTPVYSRSKLPVEYGRWLRRIAMFVFAVVIVLIAIFGGRSTDVRSQEIEVPAASPATAVGVQSEPEPQPLASEAAAVEDPVTKLDKLPCSKVQPQPLNPSKEIDFGVEDDSVRLCHNNKWQPWAAINPNKVAPSKVTLKAWTDNKTIGFGVAVIDGKTYTFRTTNFQKK